MELIKFHIMTTKDINDAETGRAFFTKLEELGIQPTGIGEYEPPNTPYTFSDAMELWTKEEPGCYDELQEKMIGQAGYMLSKNKPFNIYYTSSWWRWPNKKCINHISFWISVSKYPKASDALEELYTYMIEKVDAMYGYISHSIPEERQHTVGCLEDRIPGIFWCNYFGNAFLDFFGREKFTAKDWYKTVILPGKGIYVYLDEHPIKRILNEIELEERAKQFLGSDSFGNKQEENEAQRQNEIEWQNNPTQHKEVPKIL